MTHLTTVLYQSLPIFSPIFSPCLACVKLRSSLRSGMVGFRCISIECNYWHIALNSGNSTSWSLNDFDIFFSSIFVSLLSCCRKARWRQQMRAPWSECFKYQGRALGISFGIISHHSHHFSKTKKWGLKFTFFFGVVLLGTFPFKKLENLGVRQQNWEISECSSVFF